MLIYVIACSPMCVVTLASDCVYIQERVVMLDSGFMPPFCYWARVTETAKGKGVLLLLMVK